MTAPMFDPSWRMKAACQSEDPESFFIVRRGKIGESLKQEAKGVCWGCPVRSECALTAIAIGERWGIFGGYDMEEVREWTWYQRRKARILALAEMAQRNGSGSIPSETPTSSSGPNTA